MSEEIKKVFEKDYPNILLTHSLCGNCDEAKKILTENGNINKFKIIVVDKDPLGIQILMAANKDKIRIDGFPTVIRGDDITKPFEVCELGSDGLTLFCENDKEVKL